MSASAYDEAARRSRRARQIRRTFGRALLYCLIIGGSTFFVVPFLWMVTSSIKDPGDIWIQPPKYVPFLDFAPRWQNYRDAWNALPFNYFVRNTLIITATTTIGTTITSSIVAFGFARLRFRFRNALFVVVLATLMLPGQVTLIPLFVLFRNMGWVNTLYPLIIPALFGMPLYIFLLRQFFLTLPLELDEAARLDGCSSLGILWRIIMPLAVPALATVALFSVIARWNDFLGPLIYLNDLKMMTIAVGLLFFKGQRATDWHLLMAASTGAVMPIIAVFFFIQKQFIQGIALTGLKA
ncbi:MAG TPA: carbohydrate ABC transporter permease [Chloroflexota bacterium]|nr:carbohydrate ABC transporter permease [Chloroflexota bacterium]